MANRAQEVLYESEAALRLVDHELHRLHEIRPAAASVREARYDRAAHAEVVTQANAQIMAALMRLRERSAAQPLSEAADLLHEMERRMTAVSELLEASADADQDNDFSPDDTVIFTAAL
jgi:hypothetical protein